MVFVESFDHVDAHVKLQFWDLARFLDIVPLVKFIDGETKKNKVENVIEEFKELIIPRMGEFRKSIIQNDANASNIIVQEVNGDWQVGFVDFTDAVYTCTIFNLGICLAYMMKYHDNSLLAAEAILKSYHSVFPLTLKEVEGKSLFNNIIYEINCYFSTPIID